MQGRPRASLLAQKARAVEFFLYRTASRAGVPWWSSKHQLLLAILGQAVKDCPDMEDARRFFETGQYRDVAEAVGLDPEFVMDCIIRAGLLRPHSNRRIPSVYRRVKLRFRG